MRIKELKAGDIIIQRAGYIGLVIEKDGDSYIIYPAGGYDQIDLVYNDDLTDSSDDYNFDIMRVYRAEYGVISFSDYEEGDIVFNREETWVKP